MKTIREWAEYYYVNGIAVYPSCSNRWEVSKAYPWKQSLDAVQAFDWENSQWIGGIAGVANVTLLEFVFKDREFHYIFDVVTKSLSLLNLYRYPWVIMVDDKVYILMYCSIGDRNIAGFESISIYQDGFYQLPFETESLQSEAKFFFNGTPLIKPARVKYEDLCKTAGEIIGKFGLFFDK